MAVAAKFFTIALALGLVHSSLQSHFIQDDILAFPRYKVVVTREKVSNTDVSLKHAEASSNTIMMTSSLGQPFSCIIPDVQVEQERLEREKEESTQEETEQDVKKIIEKGLELLEPIGSNCIRFFTSTHQYWAYEYCHNQYVRQFHVERSHDGKVEKEQETASFFLGLYPGLSKESLIHADKKAVAATTKKDHANVKTELKKNGDQRYLVQKWGDGSRCDLTEKPRTIEVQYHCDLQGQDRVSSFVELSTCNYQIIISTPRLCEEMNLSHRHHIEPHKIKCRPVVSDQLIEQEQQERERKSQVNSNENQPLAAAEAEAEYQPQANEKEEQASDQELPRTDKALLGMISDLTEQINQLKLQMNAMPADTNNIRPDFSFFTLDDQGNVIPGADLAKLFGTAKQQQQQQPLQKQAVTANTEKKRPAKDQHENKQAYQQKYIAA